MNCKFCQRPQELEEYVFCSTTCRDYYVIAIERKMMKSEKISLPEELFKAWLEDETAKIDSLDLEGITSRIIELEKIIFESKTRISVAHTKRIKLQGANWADNSKAISDPSFVVNFDSDPRKRAKSEPKVKATKEEKQAQLQDAAGLDPKKLKEAIKAKMAEIAARKKAEK